MTVRTNRVPFMMNDEELKALDDWMDANRYRSRGRAVRDLIELAIRWQPACKALFGSVEELLSVYWGDGDGQEPEPGCIQRAKAAIELSKKSI